MKRITMFFYGIFLLIFSIFSYAFVDPNLTYFRNVFSDFAFSNRLLTTIFYVSLIIIFFIFYGIFLYLGRKKKINLKDIAILIGITVIILSFSYPAMLSYDVFNYVATSKVLFLYHENPYIVMPIEFIGDPLLAFTHAANKIALYGPLWILLTGIPYFFGFGNFILILFALKFFNILFYLSTVFLIWKIAKNIVYLILFSLNPLVIIETLVSGHNDIVMMFLVLLSFFLLIRKKIFLGILFFILSIFIKYTTIMLVPVLVFIIWKIFRKKSVDYENIFYYATLLMYAGFFLSPIREEIYPWYALWFLPFSFLAPNRKFLLSVSLSFSFGLLFRYVPFILTGTYADKTPVLKNFFTFFPILMVFCYFFVRDKLWLKIFSRFRS